MLIETIRTAREAALQVKHTTAAISCARSVRGQSVIRYTGHSAIRTDGIEATVEIPGNYKWLTYTAFQKRYCVLFRIFVFSL